MPEPLAQGRQDVLPRMLEFTRLGLGLVGGRESWNRSQSLGVPRQLVRMLLRANTLSTSPVATALSGIPLWPGWVCTLAPCASVSPPGSVP